LSLPSGEGKEGEYSTVVYAPCETVARAREVHDPDITSMVVNVGSDCVRILDQQVLVGFHIVVKKKDVVTAAGLDPSIA
jgi:hypothetical protein